MGRAAGVALALALLALRLVLPSHAAFAALFDTRESLPWCTGQGIVWIPVGEARHEPDPSRPSPPAGSRCPVCLLQGAPALPEAPPSVAAPASLVLARVALGDAPEPADRSAPGPENPRAPPLLG
jgi:hypothetical protein